MSPEIRFVGVEPALPETAHGFAVAFEVGPYPRDARSSHRRAIYARLRPIDEQAVAKLRSFDRDEIMGAAELDRDTSELFRQDPTGSFMLDNELEQLCAAALGPALDLARELEAAPNR